MTTYFGIDLGTSHCAIALAQGEKEAPILAPITQRVTASGVAENPLLPSAIYLPAQGEGTPLPWEDERFLTGLFARERGALQPDRLITSAKSWLCHPHVDPRTPLLPWGSQSVEAKWSPLEVSRQLLRHALEGSRSARPDLQLEPAHGVITVPASFDESARNLTLEAARLAGLGEEITLLEEPQAAFYAWLERQGSDWRSQVNPGDLLLVCDVGGGTADFSLIAVSERDGTLALDRVAVGEHLLLGGDNMDLALAHGVAEALTANGTNLDDWQFLALVQAARSAKEQLLANREMTEVSLAIPTRGRQLVASTIRASLSREQVEAFVLEGFFPQTAPDEMPTMRRSGGLREAGLAYAPDAAISRHLARFLSRARLNVASSPALQEVIGPRALTQEGLLLPDAVLFNGGAFNAPVLRERVLSLLSAWAGREVRELQGAQPDHAVALGAAAYARLRATGQGVRIRAGTARSCYIGMESAALAVPGRRPPIKALCIAPQGMEEGSRIALEGETFYLYTGEPTEFRFFTSEVRGGDQPGTLLPDASQLDESARLEATLPPPEGHAPGEEVPVQIEAVVTELGNLQLFLVHVGSGQRWQLEFNVRME